MAVKCWLACQISSSIHQPCLSSLLPLPHPFLYVTDLSLLFCSSTCFLTHPYIALALPALLLTPLQASTRNFTSLINTPVLLIWPCPVVMGRGTEEGLWVMVLDKQVVQMKIQTGKSVVLSILSGVVLAVVFFKIISAVFNGFFFFKEKLWLGSTTCRQMQNYTLI